MNVIGDIALVIAAFLLLRDTGHLDYAGVFEGAVNHYATQRRARSSGSASCILIGAFAKSAQLPLHTWLPDAMEGPTPVSSLIHAATMVTAGVYLIARCHPLFEHRPDRRRHRRDHRDARRCSSRRRSRSCRPT